MRFPSPSSSPPGHTGLVLPIRIYYEDTDAAGVVYYANYLRFCERARTEWLRSLGFEQHDLLTARSIAFVVRSVEARFLSPARLDDALELVTRVVELRGASLTFEQQLFRERELLFDSRITIACIDTLRNRPMPIPPDMRVPMQPSNPT
jgi:acyl-CoA thioester hydrolase